MINKTTLLAALKSGLAFGLGMIVGNTLVFIAADYFTFFPTRLQESSATFLIGGLLIACTMVAVGGGIAGFIGGCWLPAVSGSKRRCTYPWQAAISLGLPFGLFLFITFFIVSALSFYNTANIPPSQFAYQFLIAGLIFGALCGLLLGLLTFGWRHAIPVILASMIGFGIGGLGLGIGLRSYLLSVIEGDVASGRVQFVLLGLGSFGLLGGASLGAVFQRLADRDSESKPLKWPRYASLALLVLLVVALLLGWYSLRPAFARVANMLKPMDPGLSRQLETDAMGTHWSQPVLISDMKGEPHDPQISSRSDQVALVWINKTGDSNSVMHQSGLWDQNKLTINWKEPVVIYSGEQQISAPQIVLDMQGNSFIVWSAEGDVIYSRCSNSSCTQPITVSDISDLDCEAPTFDSRAKPIEYPVIAVDQYDHLMIIWAASDGILRYVTDNITEEQSFPDKGCFYPNPESDFTHLALAGIGDSRFSLIIASEDPKADLEVFSYDGRNWRNILPPIGQGHSPNIFVEGASSIHSAWCSPEGELTYWQAGESEIISSLACINQPQMALDDQKRLHILWYSNQVINTFGVESQGHYVYETIQTGSGWTEPAITALPGGLIQPSMGGSGGDALHKTWIGSYKGNTSLLYSNQVLYNCIDYPLPDLGQSLLEIANQTHYQPQGDIVPYCLNRYDRLLHTPGRLPGFSAEPAATNGGFDDLAELIKTTEYEALISTMEYSEDKNNDSPGSVVASAVADLYRQLAADPSNYPRGLTVRILLGNRPPFDQDDLNGMLWRVISDLRDAGVPEMVDPELGWRLEVANYDGAWPHSHAKITVIDGATVVAAGFNMEYHHFAEDHPSGLGEGTVDLAVQVTGPVAQDGRAAFDELWQGATQRHCSDFSPAYRLWQLTCRDQKANVEHVPEVLRFYIPEDEKRTSAFSMLRTMTHDEADQQVYAALAGAQETIDIIHTMYTLPQVCILDHLLKACSARQALPYMQNMLDAVKNNDVRVRMLYNLKPVTGLENVIALWALEDELEALGLSDNVEIRIMDEHVHAKDTLIDDQLLIVGSHNYHWSAHGTGSGLAEYSLGIFDPEAVGDFRSMFDYYWNKNAPE